MNILIFYDVPGWAWWYKARAIQKHIAPDIQVDILQFGQKFIPDEYDFLILFGAYMLHLPVSVPAKKLILGLSNNGPRYVESVRRAYHHGQVRAVFANSALGRELLELEEALCCQNGVDADFFHPPASKSPHFAAGWVGNPGSDGNKGLDMIQDACVQTDTRLLFTAHDATKGDLTGIRGHEHLREDIYWKASCHICASMYEGTPNPALEALACGVAVITTPVGNMPEIIRHGENGFFVERSVDGIAHGLELMKNADQETMSRAARHSILDGWTWEQKVKNYENMLRSMKG